MKHVFTNAVLIFIFICTFYRETVAQADFKTFIAPNAEFQVQIPQKWTEEKSNASILILNDPALKGRQYNFIKYKYEFSEGMTIKEVAKDILKSFKKGKNSNGDKFNSADFIKINNGKWWFIDYTSNQGTRYKSYQTISNNTKYSFYYICPEGEFTAGEEVAKHVVESFSFNVTEHEKSTVLAAGAKESKGSDTQTKNINSNKAPVTTTGLKPGDVSPGAKVINADTYGDFHEGIAVITKGNKSALINSQGEFVLDFSDFDFEHHRIYFNNGAILIRVNGSIRGFVNRKGKIINLNDNEHFGSPFRKDGKAVLTSKVLIDTNGIRTPFPGAISTPIDYTGFILGLTDYHQPERILFYDNRAKRIPTKNWGICDWNNKVITPPVFNSVDVFSEGMAAVSQIDQFGKEKWGYVDETGKLVIEYLYSNKPGKFKNGLALIEPVDKSAFEYAYINKKNEIKIKLKSTNMYSVSYISSGIGANGWGGFGYGGEFTDGYSQWDFPDQTYRRNVIVDTTGKVMSEEDFFRKINPSINFDTGLYKGYSHIGAYVNKEFYIKNLIINIQTGKISATVDEHGFYDSFSGLATGTANLDRSLREDDVTKYRAGYVDKNGVFKIIITQYSKF